MIINVILDSFISREMCFSLLRRDLFPARINNRGTSQLSLSFMPRTSNKYPLGSPEDRNCKNGGSEDSSTEQFLNCCRDCEHFVQCCFHRVPHLQSSSVRGARFTASGRPEISR